MTFSAFGVTNRKRTPGSVKRIGYKAFIEPSSDVRAFIGDYLNDNVFSLNQDHVLGVLSQVTSGDASMYFNGTNFIDKNGEIVFIQDYDRILVIISIQDRNITFPNLFLTFKNFEVLDMNGYDITMSGRVDGKLDITGTASTINITGISEALILNRTVATLNFTGSGTVIDNGVLV